MRSLYSEGIRRRRPGKPWCRSFMKYAAIQSLIRARPRRKRNEDGEVPLMDMPILKLTCPDDSKRSDSDTRMHASEGSSLERR